MKKAVTIKKATPAMHRRMTSPPQQAPMASGQQMMSKGGMVKKKGKY